MSRQQKWQLKQRGLGRCILCANKAENGKWRCAKHARQSYRYFVRWKRKNEARFEAARQRWIDKNRERYLTSQKNAYRKKRGLPLLPLPALASRYWEKRETVL